jgi:copper(I)-binding protein
MEVTAVKEGDTRLYRVIGAVIMAMALAGTLGACGAGQQAPTSVQVTATGGTEGRVGSMIVRDAKIVFDPPVPGDTVYKPGQDAPLQLTVINTGDEEDRLVEVRSSIATSSRIVGDAVVAGGQELVAGYNDPVASITLPGETDVNIALVGLTEPVRSGITYPVEFVFEREGVLPLMLPVEIPSDILPPRARDDEPNPEPDPARELETGPEVPGEPR